MTQWPRSVAVVGAGVMGVQIAALLSAAGKRVFLLDIDEDGMPSGSKARNAIVLAESKNSPFYSSIHASSIECGSIADISSIDQVDWIIEAVIEDVDIKRQVLSQIDLEGAPLPVITSNTSGLSISQLVEGRSPDFSKRFFGAHFFNPPRQMRLVEVIPGSNTDSECLSKVSDFLNSILGKVVVRARDTPNFIANRLGVFSVYSLIHLMEKNKVSVAEIDALSGPLLGRPSSATLRLCDLIGIDTLQLVVQTSLKSETMELGRRVLQTPKCILKMLNEGLLGVKSGAGFYRKEGRSIMALNLESMAYEPFEPVTLEGLSSPKGSLGSGFPDLWDNTGKWGAIIRQHLSELLAYASFHGESISESFYDIDQAMKYGFNWELGPFEIWDALGKDRVKAAMEITNTTEIDWLRKFNKDAPDGRIYRDTENLEVFSPANNTWEKATSIPKTSWKLDASKTVFGNDGAYVWDAGDDIGVLVLRGKLNALGAESLQIVQKAISDMMFSALVICGQGENFSVGANLRQILDLCEQGTNEIDQFLLNFQQTTQMLKNSPIPIIAAVHGLCLGGACEFSLASHARVVTSEARIGLVESGVGLVPSGGGILNRVERVAEGCDILKEFQVLFRGLPSQSAFAAKEVGYLLEDDKIQFGAEIPLASALEKARLMKELDAGASSSNSIKVLGRKGLDLIYNWIDGQFEDEVITAHDVVVGKAIASALCGGNGGEREITPNEILRAERDAFHLLVSTEKSRDRIAYTLSTGKRLRN
ncbi:MAG: 3-hydroxyacyl-CoA dehydrogenase NAD-binding domain-containing protein [Candidatus Latescibacterota bacterium]|nr:3-hydroxyacyl-CoA dehydrogenase NAD-binding domain-containing protein [Candidatus Latescibacterota bacterium]